jgi:hypothetical protein
MDLTPKQCREAWKCIRDMSIKGLSGIYEKLYVPMPVEAYRGESFYGGAEQPDGTSLGHNDLGHVVTDLLSTVLEKTPVGRTGSVTWTRGNGKPSYWHSEPWGHFRDTKTFVHRNRTYTGTLHNDGSKGLGVGYVMACAIWGKDIVDSLPKVEA